MTQQVLFPVNQTSNEAEKVMQMRKKNNIKYIYIFLNNQNRFELKTISQKKTSVPECEEKKDLFLC
jgi:hypothetical protein